MITTQCNVVFKDHVTNIREIKYSVEEHCSYYLLQTHATMQYITTYFIVKKRVGEVQMDFKLDASRGLSL